MLIGRKQTSDDRAWRETLANIENLVSRSEIDALAERTIDDIKRVTRGRRTAYAWSGGKDSIVLDHLCRAAGLEESFLVHCELEYPAFFRWVQENRPPGCEFVNTGQDLDWLAQNLNMLFPRDSAIAARWFSIVQHAGQRRYCTRNRVEVLVLGRRRADGNFVGRGTNQYVDRKGFVRYSPLADWRHEHILAYIHYHRLALPPIYDWPDGYRLGTHPWPARPYTRSVEEGWRQVYSIDPSIVIAAAAKIESARAFLGGLAT